MQSEQKTYLFLLKLKVNVWLLWFLKSVGNILLVLQIPSENIKVSVSFDVINNDFGK